MSAPARKITVRKKPHFKHQWLIILHEPLDVESSLFILSDDEMKDLAQRLREEGF